MASWNELLGEFNQLPQGPTDQEHAQRVAWMTAKLNESLTETARLTSDRNVILYGSAFLQKPALPAYAVAITAEDLNALMAVIHGMEWDKGLTSSFTPPAAASTRRDRRVLSPVQSSPTSRSSFPRSPCRRAP